VRDNKTVLGLGKKCTALTSVPVLSQSHRGRSAEDGRQFAFHEPTRTSSFSHPINRKIPPVISESFTSIVIARRIAEIDL